jgi:sugar (pentulose or hexulose) kinase
LWDFTKNTYHDWVYEEKIDALLPKIMPSTHTVDKELGGNMVKIGVGIHDSSSALASYLVKVKDPFLLISTGTWSISLNPYPEETLSISNLQNDCLNFLSIQGKTVKASRFFLGYELDHQISRLNQIFKKDEKYYKKINPDLPLISKILDGKIENSFYPATIAKTPMVYELFPEDNWNPEAFANYEDAYHQVIWGLTRMQVASLKLAQGNSPISKVYIDGGFVHNQVFIHLLRHFLEGYTLEFSDFPLGSAYGAALMLDGDQK